MKMTKDFTEDEEELIASYLEEDEDEDEEEETIVDGAVVDWYSPKDLTSAVVKMEKHRPTLTSGWHWEVEIPHKTASGRYGEEDKIVWRKWRRHGYAVTKIGAQYCIKKSFRRFKRYGSNGRGKVEYKVPMTEQPNYGKYAL